MLQIFHTHQAVHNLIEVTVRAFNWSKKKLEQNTGHKDEDMTTLHAFMVHFGLKLC